MPTETGTQAIDRAAGLLVRLVQTDRPWATGDLAAASGLPKSTASRLLRALERQELVQRDPESGTLRPGPVLVQYAQRGGGLLDLAALARPALQRLARASGETVNLAIATPAGVDQLVQVDSGYLLGATNWVGRPVPYHASSSGKVFLAFGTAGADGLSLPRLTPATVTDPDELERQLVEARRRGYATTAEELEPGLVAVSAPVRQVSGAVIAAISISGPSLRLSPDDLDRLGALLVEEADALSARLGHQHRQKGAA
jgi:DNA-binding IclR family transcriptional regulator